MAWLQRLRDKLGLSQRAAVLTYEQIAALIDARGGGHVAGVLVNEQTALQVSTVLGCVKVIADGCATPALHIYRDTGGARQRATALPEYRLLHRRPNEFQTSSEWRRMMTAHAALSGMGLSIKVRGANQRVTELLPVAPGSWEAVETGRYEVIYRVRDRWGTVGEFEPRDVFLLPNLQWHLLRPLPALALARNAVGLALASEMSQAKFHEQGARPSGMYSVEGTLSEQQYTALREHLKSSIQGVDRAGLPMILDRSAKYVQTQMSGVDAQHLETRRNQVEEICRAFGVFPIMVGHSDKTATFASSEAFFSAHLKHTLAPWHECWTQRIDEFLLDGAGSLFAEFDTRYLRAGSMVDRAQWARTMAELGIYTRNELREEEGKDPLPGLDKPLTPLNMDAGGDDDDDDAPAN